MIDTAHKESNHPVKGEQTVIVDLVCGMSTDDTGAYQQHEYNGETYYFCSDHCLTRFKANPADFIKTAEDNTDKDAYVPPLTFQDPICGMTTDDPDAYQQHEHDGKTYYFCSDHCLTKFKTDPEGFISGKKQKVTYEEPVTGRQYTCPMDPEIVQDHPGSCPKCGMALEPMTKLKRKILNMMI
jgi:Cu+-exporting ATPase